MATALIAEDEPILREQLSVMLTELWPELEIGAICEDGISALRFISENKPDVLFLDIRMPGLSGLEVARVASPRSHIVFITAHQEYAVSAFEQGAVDYLIKPFDAARLAMTLTRVRHRLQQQPRDLTDILDLVSQPQLKGHLKWLQVSVGNKIKFVTTNEIFYFQSDMRYTRIVSEQGEGLTRKSIKVLLDELDPEQFWQIHRSTIVNLNKIAAVEKTALGRNEVLLRDRLEKLQISQPFQHRFRHA